MHFTCCVRFRIEPAYPVEFLDRGRHPKSLFSVFKVSELEPWIIFHMDEARRFQELDGLGMLVGAFPDFQKTPWVDQNAAEHGKATRRSLFVNCGHPQRHQTRRNAKHLAVRRGKGLGTCAVLDMEPMRGSRIVLNQPLTPCRNRL